MEKEFLRPIPIDNQALLESYYTAYISTLSEEIKKVFIEEIMNKKWPLDLRKTPEILDVIEMIDGRKIHIDKSPQTHTEEYNSKYAIDFFVPIDTPVYAIDSGRIFVVEESSNQYGSGQEFANKCNYIAIMHQDRSFSEYMHLAQNTVRQQGLWKGQWVEAGQLIGYTGASGMMFDLPHLHFNYCTETSLNKWTSTRIRFIGQVPHKRVA